MYVFVCDCVAMILEFLYVLCCIRRCCVLSSFQSLRGLGDSGGVFGACCSMYLVV